MWASPKVAQLDPMKAWWSACLLAEMWGMEWAFVLV